jgi:hypothetical protein
VILPARAGGPRRPRNSCRPHTPAGASRRSGPLLPPSPVPAAAPLPHSRPCQLVSFAPWPPVRRPAAARAQFRGSGPRGQPRAPCAGRRRRLPAHPFDRACAACLFLIADLITQEPCRPLLTPGSACRPWPSFQWRAAGQPASTRGRHPRRLRATPVCYWESAACVLPLCATGNQPAAPLWPRRCTGAAPRPTNRMAPTPAARGPRCSLAAAAAGQGQGAPWPGRYPSRQGRSCPPPRPAAPCAASHAVCTINLPPRQCQPPVFGAVAFLVLSPTISMHGSARQWPSPPACARRPDSRPAAAGRLTEALPAGSPRDVRPWTRPV